MPYAADGKIAEDYFGGCIEITRDQYLEALDGMCKGMVVTTNDGFRVSPEPTPLPLPPYEPTDDDLASKARERRDYLLSVAAIRIAPLQDAVDLGKANASKKALLIKWKEYRVDLDEIPSQPSYPRDIQWPVEPS